MLVRTVERASRSRTDRRCHRCGHEIQQGERYHYLDHWRAPRSFWCADHRPRPSDMVMSPNKRRLYLAQEAVIDASGSGREAIILALKNAIQEASAVAKHYAIWEPEKQAHLDGWTDELTRLVAAIEGGEVEDLSTAVMAAAQRATIFDNWFYPEEAPELGFG